MESKLTLRLDEAVIDQAKNYALKRKKSLSRLVEEYFKALNDTETVQATPIHPLVREISGIMAIEDGISWEDDYETYLEKKYE